jgi:hypothetical protein
VDLLGQSPQDFMLRSVPVLFFPVALLHLACLGALWTQAKLLRRLEQDRGRDRILGPAGAVRL